MCSNKRAPFTEGEESVAVEYYFRAIDEFTTLIPQLFDEAFSLFFFGKAFFDAIIPLFRTDFFFFFFFDGWRYSMRWGTRFKGWDVDRAKSTSLRISMRMNWMGIVIFFGGGDHESFQRNVSNNIGKKRNPRWKFE